MTMQDLLTGVLALLVGTMFCFRGAVAMRLVITLWGAFIGFMLGAGVIAGSADAGFLRTTLGWVVGWVAAIVVGSLAYVFYEVAVVMAMAAIGFTLGTTVMVAVGVSWSWAIIAVGVAAGLLLAAGTLASNMPLVILLVLSAFSGASAIVTGIMILVGTVNTVDFTHAEITDQLHASWVWYALYLALAVSGMIAQSRFIESMHRSAREQWQHATTG